MYPPAPGARQVDVTPNHMEDVSAPGPIPTHARAATLALVLAAYLTTAPHPTPAQERPFPYRTGRMDAALLAAGSGLFALDRALVGSAPGWSASDVAALGPGTVNRLDRWAARRWSPAWEDGSEVLRGGLAVGVMGATVAPAALGERWGEVGVLGLMFLEAGLLLQGATGTLKGLTQRRRPWLHNATLSAQERLALAREAGPDARRSFPSGHASSAFALAFLAGTIHRDVHGPSSANRVVWGAGVSLAALTACARVAAGQHYPTDVLAGAALGAGVGYLVPALHRGGAPDRVRIAAGAGGIQVRVAVGGP